MLVVADASPFVGLVRIGQADVLPALYGSVVIPPQVLPGGDEMAVVLDTEGLSLGVMTTRAAPE